MKNSELKSFTLRPRECKAGFRVRNSHGLGLENLPSSQALMCVSERKRDQEAGNASNRERLAMVKPHEEANFHSGREE